MLSSSIGMGEQDRAERDKFENELKRILKACSDSGIVMRVIRRHYDVMQPKRGSFVICFDEVPEAAIKELAAETETKPTGSEIPGEAAPLLNDDNALQTPIPARNILLLEVAFDVTKLEPVVQALSEQPTTGV